MTSKQIAEKYIQENCHIGLEYNEETISDLAEIIKKYGEQHKLKWTNQKPIRPGIYLRNNPAVISIVRKDVFVIPERDNRLYITISDSITGDIISLDGLSPDFFWYGPIPTDGLPRWDGKKLPDVSDDIYHH